ncbi:ubiquitin family protein [Maridesulfovibrio frigidus]|uniref:MoaD/ThiS family protein n=1 Tax=Maridesulfovibrio frigidus TaxID=340956 RepID=UPI0004E21422|nr:MoaD/ThiS family protein [Maridesulfovibrio frigidus]
MKIKLICFGHLTVYHSNDDFLEIPNGSVTGDLPALLGFSDEDAAMYFAGEQRVSADHEILNEDVIKIFPPITGG